ncbi:glycosyltransferase involved in cell wall biosynthesis [Thermodesulfitimonas autotrophica]|uniref:Glycosyltransferase involved in cell wall biosynthesis n=1 Tax=Thermodesulfitimonas autotrophica TaxID=1894989 RepID=A0A3N5BF93_9THEO|nr:glycosyltransferase family 2 protein [Thermodesulfitimonas autotrophica]RPF46752.1 glycosyltransferase involved in cell wall biosynthesis [Thermodesulfitimonas autotrophica]
MPQVSVIVPAFNEEQGIAATLKEIAAAVTELDAEVIVVDDGSTDKTAELARACNAKVICHPVNRGKGAAMRSGFEASRGDFIIFIDADGTYPAKYIPEIVQELKKTDVVFTCRTNRENIPYFNRGGNWLITRLIKNLAGFPGNDPLSGLYGMRRGVLAAVGIESSTFAIETELVVKVSRSRFRATEIPIAYRPRLGASKLRPFRDGLRIARVLLDLLFIFQPYLTFVLPGLLIFLAGAILAGLLAVRGTVHLDGINLGLHSFLAGLAFMLLGINTAAYGGIIDLYAVRHRFKKPSRATKLLTNLALYKQLRNLSLLLLSVSVPALIYHFASWVGSGFGPFTATRSWMLALTGLLLGLQGIFTSIIYRIFAKECLMPETTATNPLVSAIAERRPRNMHG